MLKQCTEYQEFLGRELQSIIVDRAHIVLLFVDRFAVIDTRRGLNCLMPCSFNPILLSDETWMRLGVATDEELKARQFEYDAEEERRAAIARFKEYLKLRDEFEGKLADERFMAAFGIPAMAIEAVRSVGDDDQ